MKVQHYYLQKSQTIKLQVPTEGKMAPVTVRLHYIDNGQITKSCMVAFTDNTHEHRLKGLNVC